MQYQKPEISPAKEAIHTIQGIKSQGPMDSIVPGYPVHTTAAYEADE